MDDRRLQALLELPAAATRLNVRYLPLPNRIETLLSDLLAPAHLTRTAFCLALLDDDRLVMATNRRRGQEIPGGHIDPGETAEMAARRELREETGYTAGAMIPIGMLRMTSDGVAPPDWAYPHPVGFQQFFAARVRGSLPYAANDECLAPIVLDPHAVLGPNGLPPGDQALYQEARRRLSHQ